MKAWFENTPDVKGNRGNWGGRSYVWGVMGEQFEPRPREEFASEARRSFHG
jgi:hypothetical protein